MNNSGELDIRSRKSPKLLLSECFISIQGEGPSVGRLSYFIRFSGCSVGCSFCDTRYAQSSSNAKVTAVSELLQDMQSKKDRYHLVVITGGEPLEQSDAFYYLGWEITRTLNMPVEVETSLTSPVSFSITDNSLFRWIISPKDASIQEVKNSTDRVLVRWLATQFPNKTFLKPVIRDQASLDYWMKWAEGVGISKEKIYLMPQASSLRELEEKSQWLAEKAVEIGVNFSYRLHIQLWSGKRGK